MDDLPFPFPIRICHEELPKRGRPPKTAVQKLRDRVWIHVVKLRSEMSTGYSLEKAVDGPGTIRREKGHISRPRKWDFYIKGDRGPGQIKGKRDSVALAEIEFPGTASWFRHPIWRALDDQAMSSSDCDAALRMLDPTVIEVLFADDPETEGDRSKPRAFDDATAERLVALRSFDALAAAVLLARLAESIASPPLRELALNCYIQLQPVIANLPEIAPFYGELFSMIDVRCKHWNFISNNQRMDVAIFWRGMRENVWNEE